MKAGVSPETKLLNASLKVIVIDEVAVPLAVTEPVPEIVEKVLAAAPGVNTTFTVAAPDAPTGVAIARVLVSATVEAKVQVEIPVVGSLLEQAVIVLPEPVLVALKVGTTLGKTVLLFTSFKVIVTVVVEVPFAVTGPAAVMEE